MTTLFTRDGKAAVPTCTDAKGRPAICITSRPCSRCGGAGGADKWKFTGWTCFACGGARVVPAEIYQPLYTAEQNAKLDAAQAKRDATIAAKHAAAQAAEEARAEAERAQLLAANADLLDRMKAAAFDYDDPTSGAVPVIRSQFLADMVDQLEVRVRPLSEKQLAAATAAVERFEKETARKAVASHVGTVGERITLDLTFVRSIDLTRDRWSPTFVIWVFRSGNDTIVYKGGYPAAFDALPAGDAAKGATIRVTATVKAHEANRKTGEPETIIQRPKAA